MKFHFPSTRIGKIQKTNISKLNQDVEKLKPSHIAVRNVKWYNYFRNSVSVPQEVKHRIMI